MKKLISVLLALILCLSFVGSAFAAGEDGWTIFVYVCGSDLESENSLASINIQEMIDAKTAPNVRCVVQTGGASAWGIDASPDELDRFLITEGSISLVDKQPLASMGKMETLRDFLRWGLAEYPAAHTGLVLWNHGSGSINGVCFDELDDFNSLSLQDLKHALSTVKDKQPNGFDFVGFDACLMSTVETANVLKDYAKYMVASQEIEPGSGWDFTGIGSFLSENPGADASELGKVICDCYYNKCTANECEEIATLGLVDLEKINALRTAFDAYAKDLFNATEAGKDYTPIARGIAAADNFGGNNRSEGYTNMVDLGGLIDSGESMSEHAKEAREALDAAIVYKVAGENHKESSGLSAYYPLCVQGSEELGIFRDVCISTHYLGLVNKLAYGLVKGNWDSYDDSTEWDADDTAQAQGESTAISFAEEPALDDNGIYSFVLSEEGLANTESVEAVVYLEMDDDYLCLGYTSDVLADWETGAVEDNFDGYWFSLPDGQNLCVYIVNEYEDHALFTTPVEVNGIKKNLRFSWDYNAGKVEVLGLWDGIDENGIASRPGDTVKPGDSIVPIYDAFSGVSDEESTYRGDPCVWEDGDELYFDLLMDGDYHYAFCINDIFGGYYMTDFVSFSVEGEDVLFTAA